MAGSRSRRGGGGAGARPRRARSSRAAAGRGGVRRPDGAAPLCPLTGLPCGGATVRALWAAAVAGALRDGRPLVVGLIDVDGFGGHNERLGAERADDLLRGLVERVRRAAGGELELARLAADQLGFVLPGCDVEEGLSRLERVRAAVAGAPFQVRRGAARRRVDATVSVGLAGLRRDGRDAADLLAAARAGLRRAKALGGNRVGLPGREPMTLKASYYAQGQLEQVKGLARGLEVAEAVLLREALEDLFLKYKDRPPGARA